jgi:hypothetical protein
MDGPPDGIITFSLSSEANAFLLERELRRVGAVRENLRHVPAVSGVYGWWFDTAIGRHFEGTLVQDGFNLLYVGIAPRRSQEGKRRPRSLRDRLKNHCLGPIAQSTLRRTLVALLHQDQRFSISLTHKGKPIMLREDEEKLSAWMHDHARITWMIASTPRVIEENLLGVGRPRFPLNIEGSRDEFRFELKALREKMFGKGRKKALDLTKN